MTSAEPFGRAPAVGRAAALLRALADRRGAPVGLTELARHVGLAKSSALAVLTDLTEAGLVRHWERSYLLAPGVLELTRGYLGGLEEVERFEASCADVAQLDGRLVRLAVLDGTEIVYLARREGRGPAGGAKVGDRLPAAATAMGRALLCEFDDDLVRARLEPASFVRKTERSPRDFSALAPQLARARCAGFAVEVGEIRSGVIGLGVRIPRSVSDGIRLAVGVSVAGTRVEELDPHLLDGLLALSTLLSGPSAACRSAG